MTIRREWRYGNTTYLSGRVLDSRIDGSVLAPVPLGLYLRGVWDPRAEFADLWLEPGIQDLCPPLADWARKVVAAGKRPVYEMEQVIPGSDPAELDDPITRAVDFARAGNLDAAFALLQKCLEGDLRCLDAYAHLGCYRFGDGGSEWGTRLAAKCYRAAAAAGERSLPAGFDGLLLWSWVGKRPFLRALHGLGLCCWRLGDFDGAFELFLRLLEFGPDDGIGARFLVLPVQARSSYLDWVRSAEER
ncbi:MAG: tetratricopeptide repeat protein [Clostridia bacterium]|nr:tetratricopeptide repeat protein [Clostridia bacterium]